MSRDRLNGVFAWAARCADQRGGTLVLADPPDHVAASLEVLGLGRAGGGAQERGPAGYGGGQGGARIAPPGARG